MRFTLFDQPFLASLASGAEVTGAAATFFVDLTPETGTFSLVLHTGQMQSGQLIETTNFSIAFSGRSDGTDSYIRVGGTVQIETGTQTIQFSGQIKSGIFDVGTQTITFSGTLADKSEIATTFIKLTGSNYFRYNIDSGSIQIKLTGSNYVPFNDSGRLTLGLTGSNYNPYGESGTNRTILTGSNYKGHGETGTQNLVLSTGGLKTFNDIAIQILTWTGQYREFADAQNLTGQLSTGDYKTFSEPSNLSGKLITGNYSPFSESATSTGNLNTGQYKTVNIDAFTYTGNFTTGIYKEAYVDSGINTINLTGGNHKYNPPESGDVKIVLTGSNYKYNPAESGNLTVSGSTGTYFRAAVDSGNFTLSVPSGPRPIKHYIRPDEINQHFFPVEFQYNVYNEKTVSFCSEAVTADMVYLPWPRFVRNPLWYLPRLATADITDITADADVFCGSDECIYADNVDIKVDRTTETVDDTCYQYILFDLGDGIYIDVIAGYLYQNAKKADFDYIVQEGLTLADAYLQEDGYPILQEAGLFDGLYNEASGWLKTERSGYFIRE